MKKSLFFSILLIFSMITNSVLAFNESEPLNPNTPIENKSTCEEINDVTFRVNMTGQTVSPNGIYIAGSFQGWSPNTTALTNQGNGIWSVTIPNVTIGTHEYKFLNGNTWGTAESVPVACATNGNRSVNVTGTMTVPTVCFAQCAACPTTTYSVTFKVDMTGQTVSPNGVHVAGSFQNWDPSTTALTNTSGNIWSVTIPLTTEMGQAGRLPSSVTSSPSLWMMRLWRTSAASWCSWTTLTDVSQRRSSRRLKRCGCSCR